MRRRQVLADSEANADGLNPLPVSQIPRPNSHRNSGIVAIPCHAEPRSITPRSTAAPERIINGPPTSPSIAIPLGTKPDLYIRQPRISPFPTPTTKPGPSANVQPCILTSDLLAARSAAASAPAASYRNDTTAMMQRMPTAMNMHSTSRAVT